MTGISVGRIALLIFVTCGAGRAWGDTISYTGTLMSPEDTFETNVTLASSGTITLQTFGFGGGVNAAGTTISAGGFDPFVGLFSGTGDGAVFLDGTSDILSNYTPTGCPPAGTVMLGGPPACGDVNLQFTGLAAGTYSVVLSDGDFIPEAIFEDPGGTLGDGFVDFTGGAFQTCDTNGDCNTDTANWALDVTTSSSSGTSPVPEPPSIELAGLTAALAAARMYCRTKRTVGWIQGGSQ